MEVERELPPAGWDSFVASAVGGHHVQSSLWAEVKASVGWESAWLVVRRPGTIVAGVQLLSRRIGPFGRVAFGARAPLLDTDDFSALDLLLAGIDQYGRDEGVRFVKLQPPAGRDDLVSPLRARGWTPSLIEAAPVATVRLDLRQSEIELLAGMHRRRRNHVRSLARRGITVRSGAISDLDTGYRLVAGAARQGGYPAYPRHYFEKMYRVFAGHGMANLSIAYLEGRPVAAALVLAYGDSAFYKVGGSTRSTDARPSIALHWSAIRWAKERNYRWYDFEGIPRHYAEALKRDGYRARDESQGIANFKLSFGGQVELFPEALDRSPSLLLRPAVKLLSPRVGHMRVREAAQTLLGREPRPSRP